MGMGVYMGVLDLVAGSMQAAVRVASLEDGRAVFWDGFGEEVVFGGVS